MTTFGERLHDAMVWNDVTPAQLAKRRAVSRNAVRAWLRMPIARLPGQHLAWLGIELNVSIIWLALGLGAPEPLGVENQRAVRLGEKVSA